LSAFYAWLDRKSYERRFCGWKVEMVGCTPNDASGPFWTWRY
jgi:hypothetical protein